MPDALAAVIWQVAELLGLTGEISIPVVAGATRSTPRDNKEPAQSLARLGRDGISLAGEGLLRIVPSLCRIAECSPTGRSLATVAHACGLTREYWEECLPREADDTDGARTRERTAWVASRVRDQWTYLFGERPAITDSEDRSEVLGALIALQELGAKPDVLFLDDLPYISPSDLEEGQAAKLAAARDCWNAHMRRFERIFTVHQPPLPVQATHARQPERLYQMLAWELGRLRRPTAAVIDLRWYTGDTGEPLDDFGLQLIRMVRAMRPMLPVFVWSNIADGPLLQQALQLGASYYFNKEPELAAGDEAMDSSAGKRRRSSHGNPGPRPNFLNPGKLWFHIWAWEAARYAPPSRDPGAEPFLAARGPEQARNRKRVMEMLGLTTADLNRHSRNEAVRLLRALLPESSSIDILQVLGGGVSGSLSPFIAQGRSAGEGNPEGGCLKPVQVKLSRDWRALARERKGYQDVIRPSLGPAAAQVLSGPYQFGTWCGMVQSYAAPEEAYGAPATHGTKSLADVLTSHLHDADACGRLAEAVFKGVLLPFYAGRTYRADFSCQRAFAEVSPPHLTGWLIPWDDKAEVQDFSRDGLSRKDERDRREVAGRKWWALFGSASPASLFIDGLEIETLECDEADPANSRLRLLEPTLGVKVDLFPPRDTEGLRAAPGIALCWRDLERSPMKLRGQRVKLGFQAAGDDEELRLGEGWYNSIQRARELGLRAAPSLRTVGEDDQEDDQAVTGVDYLLTFYPIDHVEEFLLGPVHGDLNLRNVLIREKEGGFFPWLIDFDRTQRELPVVFDLVKLEVEAFHQVGASLFSQLCEECHLPLHEQAGTFALPDFVTELERALDGEHVGVEGKGVPELDGLWERFEHLGASEPSRSLRDRFGGFFRYLITVRRFVTKLGVEDQEYRLARLYYCLCCLKFTNLYDQKQSRRAPVAAQVLLYKLQYTARRIDRENGIDPDASEGDREIIKSLIERIRLARRAAKKHRQSLRPLCDVLDEWQIPEPEAAGGLNQGEASKHDLQSLRIKKLERLLRILCNRTIPGEGAWFREVLWYVRDAGEKGVGSEEQLAAFTVAMVRASQAPYEEVPRLRTGRRDFASTGRVANTWPTQRMFEHLATRPREMVKISSRGESGGTIDMLERAGLPICGSRAAVEEQLRRSGWAVAEAGSGLCAVDRILMKLRKRCGCMKVGDLVISSVMAKKIAVGIGSFDVQVATGYDAKFEDLSETGDRIEGVRRRWRRTWSEVHKILGSTPSAGGFRMHTFDTSGLDPKRLRNLDRRPAIIGGKGLAPVIFHELPKRSQQSLLSVLPEALPVQAQDWAEILKRLRKAGAQLWWDLGQLTSTALSGARVGVLWTVELGGNRSEHWGPTRTASFDQLAGMGALVLELGSGIRELASKGVHLRVDRLDGLHGELAACGDPRATVFVFAKRIVVLAPRSDLERRDVELWTWQILRECFSYEAPAEGSRTGAEAEAQRVVFVGPS